MSTDVQSVESTPPHSSVHPQRHSNGLLNYRREHPRGWTVFATLLLGGMSLVIGLGVTIYDGILNPLTQPMLFFVAVGMLAFYIPGLLMGYAAWGVRNGRLTAVKLGIFAAVAQGLMAAVVTPGQFVVTSFSLVLLIEGILWTAADFYVAWLLWKSLPWVATDAESHHGFEVGAVEAEAV